MKSVSYPRTVAALLVVGFALSQLEAWGQADTPDRRRPNPPEIIVHGAGEVSAAPDRATVRLGVETQAEQAAEAQDAVNAAIEKALGNITKLGIRARSIKTASLNLFPVYSPPQPGREQETPKIVAYRASNTLQIEVDDLGLVGKVIDAAMNAGVNRLEGVSFNLKNDLPQRVEALREAVREAKAKAQAIASALDVKLGDVSGVAEGGTSIVRPQQAFGMRTLAAAATPIEPGELRVQASVTVRFRIAPRGAPE